MNTRNFSLSKRCVRYAGTEERFSFQVFDSENSLAELGDRMDITIRIGETRPLS